MRRNLRFTTLICLTAVLGAIFCISALSQAQRLRRVNTEQQPSAPTSSVNKAPDATPAQQQKKTPEPGTSKPQKQTEPQKADEESGEVLRIDSKLIAVPVSVTDASGQPVKDLKPEDFNLSEEGKSQQLVTLGEPGQTPVELSLLFDVSGSVYERFKFQQDAAARFLRTVLKPKDAVSVYSIGFGPQLVQGRTKDIDQAINGLMKMQPTKEGTAFFDTVVKAVQYLSKNAEPGTRRVIVVISDGEDNNSDYYRLKDALREVQRNDILFYAINPSGPSIKLNKVSVRGHEGMTSIANETGGLAFLPDRLEELDPIFKQIAAELQAQYLLGYYSTDERADGGFRRIAVNVPKRPDLRIRARQGYYAPKA